MTRIWGIIRIKERIAFDAIVEQAQPDLDAALDGLCHALDIPQPIVLKKHRQEFLRFRRTRFSPGDFIEAVHFAGFEVEELRDRQKKDAGEAASSR